MNKHCFRLIFSKALGALIPVAETSNAQKKPGQTTGPSDIATESRLPTTLSLSRMTNHMRLRQVMIRAVLPRIVSSAVMFACAPIVVAADMVVDASAPADQRANVIQSPNGTPVIEIANPNANGLSHNRFDTFNVQDPGVIFNNSQKDGVSKIGGYVFKNANLKQQATAILTEVTGNNPSTLSGALEVFGGKADLLIA